MAKVNALRPEEAPCCYPGFWITCSQGNDKKGIIMAGKYAPLENYLRDVPANEKEVALSFEQIEGILNSKLPASAYEDGRWWQHETEGNHRSARSWSRAGWMVESLDVNAQWVRFVRPR